MKEEKMFAKFGQALKEARLTAGLSQEELALESELDRTYVSMLERGIKVPTLTTLAKIATSLSISPVELLSRSQLLDTSPHRVLRPVKKSIGKPTFFGTSVSCGKAITEDYVLEKELSLDEEFIKNPNDTFFIKASGDSMTPTIWDGDLLMVSLKKKPINSSIIIANIDNEFTVKRLFKTAKGIKLVPDNSVHKEINVSEESELKICGVVTGIIRNL
jgi:DNA polymerase V